MKNLIPFLENSLIDLVEFRAEVQGNEIAYIHLKDKNDLRVEITYLELSNRIKTLAAHLQTYHIQGERVMLMYPSGIDYIVAYFAIIFAGGIAVPVYEPRQSSHYNRLINILVDSAPRLLLTTSQTIATSSEQSLTELKKFGAQWLTTDTLNLSSISTNDWSPIALKKDDIVFLQYTSGSTGNPKGVKVSNGNLLHNSRIIANKTVPDGRSVCVSWLPPYHDMGLIGGLLQPLYAGYPCIIQSPVSVIQRPIKFLKAISDFKGTLAGGPNFIFEACVSRIRDAQLEDIDLSSWRVAFNGAEPINADTMQRFSERFAKYGFKKTSHYPCYGMAETTLFVSGAKVDQGAVLRKFDKNALQINQGVPSESNAAQVLVSSGQVSDALDVKIIDPDSGSICAERKIGEVWIRGESIAQGYWKKPEVMGQDFSGISKEEPSIKYLRSGDLAFLDSGELFITGRIKDVIIIRGKNHYPQDIEFSANRSNDLLKPDSVAAFSIDHQGMERLVLLVELNQRYDGETQQAIKESIRSEVSKNHELQILDLVFIRPGTLPKTTSGKIQRQMAKQIYIKEFYATFSQLLKTGNE